MSKDIDLKCRKVLMSAYLYYTRSENVLTDGENDALVKELVDNWDDVPERYLPLLDPDNIGPMAIVSTTYMCKWTLQIEGGAIAWLNSIGKAINCLTESQRRRNNLFIWGKDLVIPKVRTSPINTGEWGWWDDTKEHDDWLDI